MKSIRHAMILEIIENKDIETQSELAEELNRHGVKVTQATVSRDIRELKIAKMTTGKGTYRYVLPKQVEHGTGIKFSAALIDSITSVEAAQNLVVIKTFPGLAQAVASGVDSLSIHNILGCVGGDDTIIIVTTDEQSSKDISEKIKELMKTY